MYKLLKDNVMKLIEERGLSVRKVERDLGFGYGTIAYWDEHTPSVDKVEKVAKYFGVTVDYLLGYDGFYDANLKKLVDAAIGLDDADLFALLVVAEQLKKGK